MTAVDDHAEISIITPCFNAAGLITANIESVIAQSDVRVEHIVVDGGSQDGTAATLAQYSHLRWLSEPDSGQSQAFNKGLRLATAPVIGWLNADDVYVPGAVRAVLNHFDSRPEAMIINADMERVDQAGNVLEFLPANSSPFWLRHFWLHGYGLNHPATFYRREVFDTLGSIDESLHYAMDYDFYLRASQQYEFEDLHILTTRMLVHDAAKTSQGWAPFADDVRRTLAKVWRPEHPWFYRYSLGGVRCEEARCRLVNSYLAFRTGSCRQAAGEFGRAWERCPLLFCLPAFYAFLGRVLLKTLLGERGLKQLRRLRGGNPG